MAVELIQIKDGNFPKTSTIDGTGLEYIVVSKADGITYAMLTSDFKAFLGTVQTIAPKAISPSDPAPTLAGVYIPTINGTYANAGGLVRNTAVGGVDEGMAVEFLFDGVSTWVKNTYPLPEVDTSNLATKADLEEKVSTDDLFTQSGKNLFDPSKVVNGFTVNNTTGALTVSASASVSGLIEVKPNTIYIISGRNGAVGVRLASAINETIIPLKPDGNKFSESTPFFVNGVVPILTTALTKYIQFAWKTAAGVGDINVIQIEEGSTATSYEPFAPKISPENVNLSDYVKIEDVEDYIVIPEDIVRDNEIFEPMPENLFSVDNIITGKSLTGSGGITNLATAIITGLIPVTPDTVYVISGWEGPLFPFVRFLDAGENPLNPLSTDGTTLTFTIPIGTPIKSPALATHIQFQLKRDVEVAWQNARLDIGEAAVLKIKEDLLPSQNDGSELSKWTTFDNNTYGDITDKMPNFRKHWMLKDKDLMVVAVGTSLTAGSVLHCTAHPDASLRPPLFNAHNMVSYVWDKMKWQGQEYRRYDSGFFTESGTWATTADADEWDDKDIRNGLTRYSDGTVSTVAFQVPVGAWQFNLIQRLDSLGSENAKIVIAEGNGQMEVFNGSAWVEANNYVFSQRNPAVVTIPSITYFNPFTEVDETIVNYPVSGNTTFQKRLKMRCKGTGFDSRATVKNITISRTSGRLMYWGVEWSPREFMITYVNSARGSYGITVTNVKSLHRFQDNEVWGFKPDLMLTENPIHNSGGSSQPDSSRPNAYWANTTDNFFFADNHISLRSRCLDLGLQEPEWIIYNSSITFNFGGINDDGTFKIGFTKEGRALTALDTQLICHQFMKENHPEVISINAVKHFCDACIAVYGDMRTATEGSGKSGLTFTNEGSHWNDTGSRVMARAILPVLDFII